MSSPTPHTYFVYARQSIKEAVDLIKDTDEPTHLRAIFIRGKVDEVGRNIHAARRNAADIKTDRRAKAQAWLAKRLKRLRQQVEVHPAFDGHADIRLAILDQLTPIEDLQPTVQTSLF